MMIFIQINILLIVSFLLFYGIGKIERFFLTISHKASLRVSQALVIIAIVTPIILRLSPGKHEVINSPAFKILKEEENFTVKEIKINFNKIIREVPINYNKVSRSVGIEELTIFKILFAIGFLTFLIRFGLNYWKLNALLLQAHSLRNSKKVKVVVTEHISIPFSVRMISGYWVAMPLEVLTQKIDFNLALKHEFQHHRQFDTTWAMVIELLTCFFYFNPAIYLWKNLIIELQELSCDETLTGRFGVLSHDYGSCLLRVAESALKNRQIFVGTTCMTAIIKNSKYFKKFLLRRIEMILGDKRNQVKWLPVCTGIFIALSTVCFAYGVDKVMKTKAEIVNPGKLVVDQNIQKIAKLALEKALKDTKFSAGFVIVSNPNTGKILAVTNIDKKNRLKGHWALSQLIEPASIGKTFIIAEAIDKKLVNPDSHFKCENGKYNYNGKVYYDWRTEGFDELTTTQTLAISSNICSMKIAEKIGADSLKDMSEKFGFGTNEITKNFPEARPGSKVILSDDFIPRIAYGYASRNSALEIMQAFGAIVNGEN